MAVDPHMPGSSFLPFSNAPERRKFRLPTLQLPSIPRPALFRWSKKSPTAPPDILPLGVETDTDTGHGAYTGRNGSSRASVTFNGNGNPRHSTQGYATTTFKGRKLHKQRNEYDRSKSPHPPVTRRFGLDNAAMSSPSAPDFMPPRHPRPASHQGPPRHPRAHTPSADSRSRPASPELMVSFYDALGTSATPSLLSPSPTRHPHISRRLGPDTFTSPSWPVRSPSPTPMAYPSRPYTPPFGSPRRSLSPQPSRAGKPKTSRRPHTAPSFHGDGSRPPAYDKLAPVPRSPRVRNQPLPLTSKKNRASILANAPRAQPLLYPVYTTNSSAHNSSAHNSSSRPDRSKKTARKESPFAYAPSSSDQSETASSAAQISDSPSPVRATPSSLNTVHRPHTPTRRPHTPSRTSCSPRTPRRPATSHGPGSPVTEVLYESGSESFAAPSAYPFLRDAPGGAPWHPTPEPPAGSAHGTPLKPSKAQSHATPGAPPPSRAGSVPSPTPSSGRNHRRSFLPGVKNNIRSSLSSLSISSSETGIRYTALHHLVSGSGSSLPGPFPVPGGSGRHGSMDTAVGVCGGDKRDTTNAELPPALPFSRPNSPAASVAGRGSPHPAPAPGAFPTFGHGKRPRRSTDPEYWAVPEKGNRRDGEC